MAAITSLVKRTPSLSCAARRFSSHPRRARTGTSSGCSWGAPASEKAPTRAASATSSASLTSPPAISSATSSPPTAPFLPSVNVIGIFTILDLVFELSEIVNQGKLVSDEIIISLLSKRLADGEAKGESGFILDGFPRTMKQAEILEGVTDIDLVVNLKLQEEALLAKCLGRRICNQCGGNFNVASISIKGENGHPGMVMAPLLPPAHCMSKLITRSDDTEVVVKERLRIYNEKSQPVEEFYRSRGKLLEFDLPGGIPESWPKLLQALNLDDYEEKQSAAA
ncbi:Adenylate kinase 1 [Spatholobus suberectus]|nr:Adenylate kinase 1 [Spatholobus suberectus]